MTRTGLNSTRLAVVLGYLSMGLIIASCQNNITTGFKSTSSTPTPADEASSGLKLGDRSYVASSLETAFGTSSSVTSVTNSLIRSQSDSFGGPWDRFQNPSEVVCDPVYPSAGCTSEHLSQSPIGPSPTSLREAFRVRACYSILAEGKEEFGLRYAINLAKDIPTSASVIWASLGAPTSDEIISAFEIFNPGEEIGDTLLNALYQLTQNISASSSVGSSPNREAWRFLFLSLCADPSWQVL